MPRPWQRRVPSSLAIHTSIQNPTTDGSFFPPLAMQQSIWDSITNGNFIDAKIFAFSRRSLNRPGRVHTPKALFVNTRVLAASCSYFRSTFDFSDGVETSMGAGFPADLDTFFDMEEDDLDSDYDLAEEEPAHSETTPEAPAEEIPVKAYLVKYTAYKALLAIIWYLYSGETFLSRNGSADSPVASTEAIYRFADEHGMNDLKALALREISRSISIDQMEQSRLLNAAFTPFASRSPPIRDLYIQRLRYFLAYGPNEHFRQQLFRYFSGEIPRSRNLLISLLQAIMDGSVTNDNPLGVDNDHGAITKVFRPWPARTKKALRASLDRGVFENIRATVPSGPESTEQLMYFAGAVDERVGTSISRLCQSELTSEQAIGLSLLTWRAIAYYMYTNCINFKPLGTESPERVPSHGPTDVLFQGYPCPPKEVLYVARKLDTCDALVDLAANEIVSQMTPENVIEEMFWNSPAPTKIIERGVEIIRENRGSSHIRSQLERILEEAASGESSENAPAFFACFTELLRASDHHSNSTNSGDYQGDRPSNFLSQAYPLF